MWPIGHFSRIANYRNDLTCVHKSTNFLQQFGIVLIDGNEVPGMLDGYHIPRFLRPIADYDGAVGNALHRLVLLGDHVDPEMALLGIVTIGYITGDRGKEEFVLTLAILIAGKRHTR